MQNKLFLIGHRNYFKNLVIIQENNYKVIFIRINNLLKVEVKGIQIYMIQELKILVNFQLQF